MTALCVLFLSHIMAMIHEFIILSLVVLDEYLVLEPLFCGDVDYKVGTLPLVIVYLLAFMPKMGMPRLSP